MFKINVLALISLSLLSFGAAQSAHAEHRTPDTFPDIKTQGIPPRNLDQRTANRTVSADLYPLRRPVERQNLGANHRTWSAKHYHPKRWRSQDWDPSHWPENMTPLSVIENFYAAGYLADQYMDQRGTPILVTGPNFYELSHHDKRRILALLETHHDILDDIQPSIVLIDWFTKEYVGQYTYQGDLEMELESAP